MGDILISLHGNRIGLDSSGNLIIDGVAASIGVNFGAGSAASPSIAFSADTDTGIYRKAANNIGFAVNGAIGMDLSTTALTLATGTDLVFSGTTGQCLIQFTDNLADALTIGEGANAYLTFVSTNSSEAITASKVLKLAAGLTYTGATGVNLVSIPDNLASALDFTEGSNSYLKFVTTNSSEAIAVGQNLVMGVAAKGLVLKQGANGKCGTFVANGVTPVTVSNTSIATTDAIIISLNTVGGTVGVQPHLATITASTGFTVVCTASDTSTYNYTIISNAA